MVSFVNFERIASLCVGFYLGTLHGYVFHQDFWPNLNFQLEYQIKLVLISCYMVLWIKCLSTSFLFPPSVFHVYRHGSLLVLLFV